MTTAKRILRFSRLVLTRSLRGRAISLVHRHADVAPPPVNAVVRMSNKCNLRCRQCGQWGDRGVFHIAEPSVVHGEVGTSQWRRIIERLAKFCPHIYFFGGEPFVRRDLMEVIAAATAHAVVGVNTNGTLLAGKGAEIVASRLDYMIVSLDGPELVNNKIRAGSSNVYESVLHGVQELIRAKKAAGTKYPAIELLMTLTPENQHYIEQTARIAKQLGVDKFAVGFGIFTTPALAAASAELVLSEFGSRPTFFNGFVRDVSGMQPEAIEAEVGAARRIWGGRFKTYPPGRFNVRDYYETPERPLIHRQCLTPWTTMQILTNADVAFCSDFPDFVAGNALKDDLLDIWNNSVSRAWRNRIRTKGIFPAESRCCDYYL